MWKVSREDNTPEGINRVYARVNIGSGFESESIFHLCRQDNQWYDLHGEVIDKDSTKVLYFFDYSNYPNPKQQLD